jgi:hypothetical protein
MKLIDLTLDAETLGTRSAMSLHSTLGLRRGLEFLERVVLHDPFSDEFHSGRVVGIAFELADTVYTFQVGVRLPRELALRRLASTATDDAGIELAELAELLGVYP